MRLMFVKLFVIDLNGELFTKDSTNVNYVFQLIHSKQSYSIFSDFHIKITYNI